MTCHDLRSTRACARPYSGIGITFAGLSVPQPPTAAEAAIPSPRPRRAMTPLLAAELLAVVAFVVLAGWAVTREQTQGNLRPIDPEALVTGASQDRWMGIFFEDQPVGYAVTSQSATVGGGTLTRSRSLFRIVAMGSIQQVITAGSAVLTPEREMERFEFFMDSDQVRLSVRGEMRPGELHMEILQAGEVSTISLPMDRAPAMSMSLDRILARDDMMVGQKYTVPYFDPVTLAQDEMEIEVTGVELIPGTAEEAYWLTTRFAGVESRRLVTPSGETLREEGGLGLSLVRMTRAEAEALLDDSEPVDLIARSAVSLARPIPKARSSKVLEVLVTGIGDAAIPHQPPQQVVDGAAVKVMMPLAAEIPSLPRHLTGTLWEINGSPLFLEPPDGLPEPPEGAILEALQPGMLTPSDHREIQDAAWTILEHVPDRKQAAQELVRWVFAELDKRPVLSLPNGLEVLRRREGDCNEHTALYVSLARAAGLPARIAAGLVYTDQIDGKPAFYYHAWPEVHLGGTTPWVPVDPTFGQFPADATHIKLVEGDLDRQVEILGLMGHIQVEVVEAR